MLFEGRKRHCLRMTSNNSSNSYSDDTSSSPGSGDRLFLSSAESVESTRNLASLSSTTSRVGILFDNSRQIDESNFSQRPFGKEKNKISNEFKSKKRMSYLNIFTFRPKVPPTEILLYDDFTLSNWNDNDTQPGRTFRPSLALVRSKKFQCCTGLFILIGLIFVICIWEGLFNFGKVRTFTNEVDVEKNGSVVLLGDSLISYPSDSFKLLEKIQAYSKYSNLGITNCGQGGNTIADIRERLDDVLGNVLEVTQVTRAVSNAKVNRNSSVMVILYWDSDCSDYDETSMNEIEIQFFRAAYIANVKYVIQRIFDVGAYAAIGGPALLLSTPWKENILNDYREINRNISKAMNIEYIDVRSAFQSSLDAGKNPTYDGEHPNEIGASITASLFAHQIDLWKGFTPKSTYSKRPTGPTKTPSQSRSPTLRPTPRPSLLPSAAF